MENKKAEKIDKNTIKKKVKITEKKTKTKPKKGLHGNDTVATRSQKFRLQQKKKEKLPLKERIKKVDKRVWLALIAIIIVAIIIISVMLLSKSLYIVTGLSK